MLLHIPISQRLTKLRKTVLFVGHLSGNIDYLMGNRCVLLLLIKYLRHEMFRADLSVSIMRSIEANTVTLRSVEKGGKKSMRISLACGPCLK